MPHQSKDKMFEIDEHIMKRFDVQKRLGKGAYGIVWKAIDRKTKQVVAVKKIFDAFRNQTDAQRTFREIMFLQSLKNHPNIVKLHSIHRAANNSDIYLGFEYMETDLHNVIKRKILKEIHKKYIMYQLLKAIKYIHSGNVIHRDLKPSNVLLDINCRCKIADFGLARSLTQATHDGSFGDGDPTLTDYVATRWYRAPEILIANRRYTKGIDMWSLGCILAEMQAGKPIFPGSSTVNQVERIMATIPAPTQEEICIVCVSGVGSSMIKNACMSVEKVPLLSILNNGANNNSNNNTNKSINRDVISLISQLLVFNPTQRLTAEEALEHDYVATFHDPEKEILLTKDIIIPFNDDIQLSVEHYRNKLYELMSSSNHQQHLLMKQQKKIIPEIYSKVAVSKANLKTNSKSDSKIIQNKLNVVTSTTTNTRSDSKVIMPKTTTINLQQVDYNNRNRINKTVINNNYKTTQKSQIHNFNSNTTKLNNSKSNIYTSYNSFNRTHGIITQSALMELKSSGLR